MTATLTRYLTLVSVLLITGACTGPVAVSGGTECRDRLLGIWDAVIMARYPDHWTPGSTKSVITFSLPRSLTATSETRPTFDNLEIRWNGKLAKYDMYDGNDCHVRFQFPAPGFEVAKVVLNFDGNGLSGSWNMGSHAPEYVNAVKR